MRTFAAVAEAGPTDTSSWRRVVGEVEPRRARHAAAVAAAVVLTMAGAVGVWSVATRDRGAPRADDVDAAQPFTLPPSVPPPAPIDPPAPLAPLGQEYPIHAVVPIEPVSVGSLVADVSSIRSWRTADAELFSLKAMSVQGDHVVELECSGEKLAGGVLAGCGLALEAGLRPLAGGSWREPEGEQGSGTWIWSNVPEATEFVQYYAGDLVLWQRPVGGMVAFPATSESGLDVIAVAYRADGAVLGRADRATADAAAAAAATALPGLHEPSSLPPDLQPVVRSDVGEEFASCLEHGGFTIAADPLSGPSSFADPGPGVDADAVWQACLFAAQDWLDGFIAANQ